MDAEYFLMLFADYAPKFLELILLAFGIWLINTLRK